MDETGQERHRAPADWARIRQDYEGSPQTIAQICQLHGVDVRALHLRRAKEGWARRRPPRAAAPARAAARQPLSATLSGLIKRETAALQARLADPELTEQERLRSIEAIAQLVGRALDIRNKELKLDPDSAAKPPLPIVDDARREELARCIRRLWRERAAAKAAGAHRPDGAEPAGGGG